MELRASSLNGQLTKWEITQLDGTVLLSFTLAPGEVFTWYPAPGTEIRDPCVGWLRTPDGNQERYYYPAGIPGDAVPWPVHEPGSRIPLVVVPDRIAEAILG